MSGKSTISSGTEDLSSQTILDTLTEALGGSTESQDALMSMFFSAKAQKEDISAAFESFNGSVPSANPQTGACGECDCEKRRPLVSKVIDKSGVTKITILYDGNPTTGGGDTGMFTGLMDAAGENDIVDITIMTTLYDFAYPKCNIFATLSLLSAIQRCKAKVITRAGCLCSVGDCAVWLSGDERHMSPMGWLAVKQPTACGGGTMKDAEFRAEDFKDQLKKFTDYIVDCGLLTSDEVTRMYEEQAVIGLSYDELDERIKNLKNA